MGERKTVKQIFIRSLSLLVLMIQLTPQHDCDEATDLAADPSRNTTLEGVFEAPSIAETVRGNQPACVSWDDVLIVMVDVYHATRSAHYCLTGRIQVR